MRIYTTVTKEEMLWSFIKLSQLILSQMYEDQFLVCSPALNDLNIWPNKFSTKVTALFQTAVVGICRLKTWGIHEIYMCIVCLFHFIALFIEIRKL